MNLAFEFLVFLAPLEDLATLRGAERMLRDVGVLRGALITVPAPLARIVEHLVEVTATLRQLSDDHDGGVESPVAVILPLARQIMEAIMALREVTASSLIEEAADQPWADPTWWRSVAEALPSYLFTHWLSTLHPVADSVLRFAGVVAPGQDGRPRLQFSAVKELLSDPPAHLRARIADDPTVLLPVIRSIAASMQILQPRQIVRLIDGAWTVEDDPALLTLSGTALRIAALGPTGGGVLDSGLERGTVDGSPALNFVLRASGDLSLSVPLSPSWSLSGSLTADGTMGVALTRDGFRSLPLSTTDRVAFALTGAPEAPWLLFGDREGARFEVGGLALTIGAEGLLGAPKVRVDASLERMRVVIAPSAGDSFLNEVLGTALRGEELVADASLRAAWSSESGLAISGGASLGVVIPVDRKVGPLTIDTVRLSLDVGSAGVTLDSGLTVGLLLGPLAVTVVEIGLVLHIDPSDGEGGFGEFDVGLVFRPPTGLGLSIDAETVRGGGYLFLDFERGRYAGFLELLTPAFGIAAVGILDTKLPPELGGWSLFLALSANFNPGIQLGFGFVLSGVGGVAAVNRRLDAPALRGAVRAGNLDTVLFPHDLVAEAPRIIASVDAMFPLAKGSFVFGPMVKIGYGTPTIIEAMLGVFISLPSPVVIALLGRIHCALPKPDSVVIELNMDVAGILDFGAGTFSLDARIHDSRLLKFSLSGDMAFRLWFKRNPAFLLSVGGFHPDFEPPGDVGPLERMTLGLPASEGDGPALEISFRAYFAITSNTLQFGAAFVLDGEVAGFRIHGDTSFDALITFSPFHLTTTFSLSLSVGWESFDLLGVHVDLQLDGPGPWRARGHAIFTIVGFEAEFEFDKTFGPATSGSALPPESVWGLLVPALKKSDAWRAVADADSAVIVRPPDQSPTGEGDVARLWAAPDARVELRQRVVPLDVKIERLGATTPKESGPFKLTSATVGQAPINSAPIEDFFAPALFFKLSEDERLASPSFTPMNAGVSLDDGVLQFVSPKSVAIEHEEKIWDPDRKVWVGPTTPTASPWQGRVQKGRFERPRIGSVPAPLNVVNTVYAGPAATSANQRWVDARDVAKTTSVEGTTAPVRNPARKVRLGWPRVA
ncbi:MAG: hypothetical protein Q8S73_30535 [Deltaproteobacteria bacterium]|nr:hypothetical protein [Myxococcales bacterium]MDP3218482.1 hypothetical protein [Deltaproteobacteria bacterium]